MSTPTTEQTSGSVAEPAVVMPDPSRRLLFRDATKRPVIDFVLPGLPVGTSGLLVGQGAIGKSLLTLQVGVGVVLGKPIATGPAGELFEAPRRGSVAIIAGEETRELMLTRMHELLEEDSLTHEPLIAPHEIELVDDPRGLWIESGLGVDTRIVTRNGRGFAIGPWFEYLTALARGRRLMILDPLAFLHDLDENDNGAMTFLMRTVSMIAVRAGCAFLILHHVSKPGDGKPDDWSRSRGASSLTTAARLQLDMRTPTEAEAESLGIDPIQRGYWVRVARVKANYAPPTQPTMLSRTGPGGLLRCADPQASPSERRRKGAAAPAAVGGWEDME